MTKFKMTKQNVAKKISEVFINVPEFGEIRKPAFAFFNRDVNLKHADSIFEKMKINGFRESLPIQVICAEKSGLYKLFDLNGIELLEDDFKNYFLVIDGQHRTRAVSQYNEWLKENEQLPIDVPAIFASIKEGESIVSYINEINVTLKEWTKEDFLIGAANVNTEIPLLQRYKELIKKPSNPNGIPLSTLNKIYCNSSGLTKQDFVLLCYGEKVKGKANKSIIPAHDITTGNKFLELCQKAGFDKTEIAKRYLVSEFNNLAIEQDKVFAINVFEQITEDDAAAMLNKSSHLDEEKVTAQIKLVKERFLTSKRNKSKEQEQPEEVQEDSVKEPKEQTAA